MAAIAGKITAFQASATMFHTDTITFQPCATKFQTDTTTFQPITTIGSGAIRANRGRGGPQIVKEHASKTSCQRRKRKTSLS